MKKIINKIKANKNLCKGLKVFKLILDCLVYGFAIFMIIGLAVGQSYIHKVEKSQERQLIPNVATTPIKHIGYIDHAGYICASYNDIASTDFFWGFWNVAEDMGGDWTDLIYSGNGTQRLTFAYPICYYSTWFDIDFVDTSTWTKVSVYGFQMNWQRNYDYTNSYGQRFREIKIAVTSVDSNNNAVGDSIRYMLYIYFDNSNKPLGINIVVDTSATLSSVMQYTTNSSINNGIFLSMLNGNNDNLYQTGWNDGYDQGLADSASSSNVFDLIKSAFNSIASILNIQLLPGLNLGLIIFAPVVITIIVVIVKMFRG